jgi:hypothetical protein
MLQIILQDLRKLILSKAASNKGNEEDSEGFVSKSPQKKIIMKLV